MRCTVIWCAGNSEIALATWFNWSPLSPLMERYVDDGTRDLCTADISIEDAGNFKLSLVGTKRHIELIRVATLDSNGNLSAKQGETIGKLVDHTLAILKLTYDVGVDLVRWGANTISIGAHDVNGKPNLSVRISEIIDAHAEVAVENIRNVLVASMGQRPLFKLLADAQMPLLPLQYRYLSLYKILELEFRVARRWIGLQKLLAPYYNDYKALNIGARPLSKLIHQMRDKCAHIKVGGNDSLGIIGLDGPDAKIVTALVGLLLRILSNHLNSKSMGLTFVHTPSEPLQPIRAETMRGREGNH
jgi:hypothetical protein